MERTEIINFSSYTEMVAFTVVLFAIIFLRYILVSAVFFAVFYRLWPEKFRHRKVSSGSWKPGQFRRELAYSAITSLIFAVAGLGLLWAWQTGHTAIYSDFSGFGAVYFLFSLAAALFLHETCYYWLHRWMHRPAVFKRVHKVHHQSIASSPWTAFSFHPWESLLQALIVTLIVWLLPMHYVAILVLLIIMTVSAVINHLDVEIYPEGFEKHWLGKWLIGATHHSLHHEEFNSNYGLYFTFWDKWAGTESKAFQRLFGEKTKKPSGAASQ